MRVASLLLLVALSAAAAPEDNLTVKLDSRLKVTDFVEQMHASMGLLVLHAPGDLGDRKLGGSYDVELSKAHMGDLFAFVLRCCDLQVRQFGRFWVVVPSSALTSDFRLTGVEAPLHFNRGPGAWSGVDDMAGSLAAETAGALLAEARAGNPLAAELAGACGPRTAATVDGLAGLLADAPPEVGAAAAAALSAIGWQARGALPRLEKAAAGTGPCAKAAREAAHEIGTALHPALLDPALANEKAPDTYTVRMDTTEGTFEIEVDRTLAPIAADRFYNLVRIGYFDGARFFRVIEGFVAQFGKSGDPRVNAVWHSANLKDEPVKGSNKRGTLSFAKTGLPNSRSTQVFINLADNTNLDGMGFAPFGRVVKGMDVVERLYHDYGERPDQGKIHYDGEAYLAAQFPELDKIRSARIVE